MSEATNGAPGANPSDKPAKKLSGAAAKSAAAKAAASQAPERPKARVAAGRPPRSRDEDVNIVEDEPEDLRPPAPRAAPPAPMVLIEHIVPEGSYRLNSRIKGEPDTVFSEDHGLRKRVPKKMADYLLKLVYTTYDSENGNATTAQRFRLVLDDEE